jgi:CheY-like chemotaxis protein
MPTRIEAPLGPRLPLRAETTRWAPVMRRASQEKPRTERDTMLRDATTTGWSSESTQLALLVIEDALIHRTIISRIGDKVGFTTEAASTVEAAAELLRAREFDCITLDLSLGERFGADILRLLADLKCQTPIVIISGSDAGLVEETSRLGRSLDLNLWKPLHKPVDLTLLRELLEQVRVCSGLHRIARA